MNSDRLRQLRQDRGISQEELAEMIGISHRQVWRYEKGETKPFGDTVAEIAAVLNTSTDYLLGLSDDPLPQSNNDLSSQEQDVIAAWRRGDLVAAIRRMVAEG